MEGARDAGAAIRHAAGGVLILLFSLRCPNGHPVGGEPHEYPGPETPPDAWMDNLSHQLARHFRNHREEWMECRFCGASLYRGCSICVDEMKARTMEEARAALDKIGVLERA